MKLVLPPKGAIAEAVSAGFQYWWTNEEGKSHTCAIQCKDFFTDAMWTEYIGKDSVVYGFASKVGTYDLKAPFQFMVLGHTAMEMAKYAKQLQEFMAEVDEKMGFRRTIVTPVEGKLFVKFSTEWTKQPWLISAFTQLIRVGPTYDGKGIVSFLKGMKANPVCSYDNTRLPQVAERVERILKGERFKYEYADYSTAGHAHGLGGLISIKI
jgi:hypothetical protein